MSDQDKALREEAEKACKILQGVEFKDAEAMNKAVYQLSEYLSKNINNTPHKCPICYGTGLVSGGFYLSAIGGSATSTTVSEKCRQCNGGGIILGASNKSQLSEAHKEIEIYQKDCSDLRAIIVEKNKEIEELKARLDASSLLYKDSIKEIETHINEKVHWFKSYTDLKSDLEKANARIKELDGDAVTNNVGGICDCIRMNTEDNILCDNKCPKNIPRI